MKLRCGDQASVFFWRIISLSSLTLARPRPVDRFPFFSSLLPTLYNKPRRSSSPSPEPVNGIAPYPFPTNLSSVRPCFMSCSPGVNPPLVTPQQKMVFAGASLIPFSSFRIFTIGANLEFFSSRSFEDKYQGSYHLPLLCSLF